MPHCAVINCANSSRVVNRETDDISFHRFPDDPILKGKWIAATGNKDWFPTKFSKICSIHFNKKFMRGSYRRRQLAKSAIPTIHILQNMSEEETNEVPVTEEPIKQEIDEEFSEHEDDIEEKLENRKRQLEADPLELDQGVEPGSLDFDVSLDTPKKLAKEENVEAEFDTSANALMAQLHEKPDITKETATTADVYPKLRSKELLTVEVERDSCTAPFFTMDFMKSVLNSQKEILTVLKSQVLLQDQDTEIIKFLRLVGAKLSRVEETRRKEIQEAIIEFLNKND